MFTCAYLPDLMYLDFRRIDDHMASVFLWVSQPCESVSMPPRLHGKDTEAVLPVHTKRDERITPSS